MSDLAGSLRQRLAETAEVVPPRMLRDSVAADGTRKWLLDLGAANAVETVFIPEENRGTLCVSTPGGLHDGVPVLLDRPPGLQSQPHHRGDRRPALVGQPRPGRGARYGAGDQQRGADGHGRAAPQSRERASRAAAHARRQRLWALAAARDRVDGRNRADDGSAARRVPGGARGEPARAERRAAQPVDSDQREISACDAVRGVPTLPGEGAARLRDVRVRDAGRRERLRCAGARAGAARRRSALQDQPDPLQPVPGLGFRALAARDGAAFLGDSQLGGHRDDDAQDPRATTSTAACGQLAGQVRDRTRRAPRLARVE